MKTNSIRNFCEITGITSGNQVEIVDLSQTLVCANRVPKKLVNECA